MVERMVDWDIGCTSLYGLIVYIMESPFESRRLKRYASITLSVN